MLKATLGKKWVYGNPGDVPGADWFRWIRFVNIVADDHLPGTTIYTEWDDKGNLFGYSRSLVQLDGEPARPEELSGHPYTIDGLREAVEAAEVEDWAIETHPGVFDIAMRVMAWIEKMEAAQKKRDDAVRHALET